jgi:hypothetical protein
MAFTPIAVPIWFMGIPIPKTKDGNKETDKELAEYVQDKTQAITQIHLQCHRDGTIWVYPFFDTEEGVVWEFIPDYTVSDVIRDINTGKIIQVITDEQISIKSGYNQIVNVERRRYFTAGEIVEEYSGDYIPAELRNRTKRNVSGFLPIPFSNNSDGDEVRGHSDYERIVPDLKNYHDVDLKQSQILSKFDPKMVQSVKDAKLWLENNGYDSINDIDISSIDLIMNLYEQEDTKFVFPENAYQAYESKLKNTFKKIVEGSGISEILWGIKTEGNHASAEEQLDIVVKYIDDKRLQKNKAYRQLFDATLKLERLASIRNFDDIELKIEWNNLDAISEKIKSEIFANFSKGVNMLISAAGVTKPQLYEFYKKLYPYATEETYDDWVVGLSQMALHKAFKDSTYDVAQDFSGSPEEQEVEI